MDDARPDPLGTLLDRSAPPVPAAPGLERELGLLAARTRGRRRIAPRAALAGAIGIVVAGGTAVAAAAVGWVPWFDADVIFEYIAPSGEVCQMAIGEVEAGGRADVVAAVQDILRTGDVYGRADIEAELAAQPQQTPPRDADAVYRAAMIIAINKVIGADLAERIRDANEFSWHGDDSCLDPAR